MKVLIFLAVLLAVTAGLWKSKAVLHQQTKTSIHQAEDPTTLRSRIKKVRARGDKDVTFLAPEVVVEEVSGLEELLRADASVEAGLSHRSVFKNSAAI